jgi:hypothetical protein
LLLDETDIEDGKEFHNYAAARSLVIDFIKTKQSKNPQFLGEVNGQFNHGAVMQYVEELVADGAWSFAPCDREPMPSGKKTYLADRISGAMCGLEREGILERERKGGHTVWAKEVLR